MPTRFENFERSPRCLTPGASCFLEACSLHPLFRCRGHSPFPPGYLYEVMNALEKGCSGGGRLCSYGQGQLLPQRQFAVAAKLNYEVRPAHMEGQDVGDVQGRRLHPGLALHPVNLLPHLKAWTGLQ